MKVRNGIFATLCVIGLLMANVTSAYAFPPLPSSHFGTVQVSGANVADGTQVSAWINGVRYAYTYTQTYNGASVYSLDVPGDDPATTNVIEGGVPGNTI